METIKSRSEKEKAGSRWLTISRFSFNSSFLYLGIGQLIVGVAGLLYAKLSAWFISPGQLGIYNLGFVSMTFVHTLVVIPSIQSFRATLLHHDYKEVVNFYLRVLLLIYSVLLVVLLVIGLLNDYLDYAILIGVAAVGQGFYTLSNDFLNTTGQQRRFVLMQVLLAVGNVALFGLIVLWGGYRSAFGIWIVMAILNTVVAGTSMGAAFRSDRSFRWSPWPIHKFRQSFFVTPWIRFTLPLVFVALFVCSNNYLDRYFILYFRTNEDVGYYSMGYSLGSRILLLATPFSYYIAPKVFQAQAANASRQEVYNLFFFVLKRYLPLVIGGVACYFLLYDWVGELLLSRTYQPAYLIGPLIALGYILFTVTQMLDLKFYAYRQTKFMLWHNCAGAVCNLFLNLWLIPQFGIVGAALATIGGFAVQLLTAIYLFRHE